VLFSKKKKNDATPVSTARMPTGLVIKGVSTDLYYETLKVNVIQAPN